MHNQTVVTQEVVISQEEEKIKTSLKTICSLLAQNSTERLKQLSEQVDAQVIIDKTNNCVVGAIFGKTVST